MMRRFAPALTIALLTFGSGVALASALHGNSILLELIQFYLLAMIALPSGLYCFIRAVIRLVQKPRTFLSSSALLCISLPLIVVGATALFWAMIVTAAEISLVIYPD